MARSRRLDDQVWRWTAADPSLRWFRQNAAGLDVQVEDISEQVAALAVQGPTSARLLKAVADVDLDPLKYFRMTRGRIADVPVEISRTGYTGDLGYEVWMPWDRATDVWDRLIAVGKAYDAKPAGMLALDVARIEAGLLLIDVDFHGSRKVSVDRSVTRPTRWGWAGWSATARRPSSGARRSAPSARRATAAGRRPRDRWTDVESLYTKVGLTPQVPIAASRVAVPVYKGGRQVGKATSTTWSPVLKKLIALATIDRPHFATGTTLEVEITVEAVRHRARADGRADAVLQPAAEDRGAGLKAPSSETSSSALLKFVSESAHRQFASGHFYVCTAPSPHFFSSSWVPLLSARSRAPARSCWPAWATTRTRFRRPTPRRRRSSTRGLRCSTTSTTPKPSGRF